MNRSVDGDTRTDDTSDTWSLANKSTRELTPADRLILERSVSWVAARIKLCARYDTLGDLKAAIATQLERIGFVMPKVDYRPSFARNFVKYNVRRRALMRGVSISRNSRNKALVPAGKEAMNLDTVSSPLTANRRESVSSDFAIYSPPPEDEPEPEPVRSSFIPPPPPPLDEPEPASSGIKTPPPPPPNEPEPPRSEVTPLSVSNRQDRVSFNLTNRSTPSPAKRNSISLSKRPDLLGTRSTSTSSLALLETRGEDDEEDVYSMCKRTLNRLFRNQTDNCIICPLCEQNLP